MIDMLDLNFKAFIYGLLSLLLGLAIIIPIAVIGLVSIDKLAASSCEAKGKVINMEVQYNAPIGCMVKTEQGWINYEKLLYIKNLNINSEK